MPLEVAILLAWAATGLLGWYVAVRRYSVDLSRREWRDWFVALACMALGPVTFFIIATVG